MFDRVKGHSHILEIFMSQTNPRISINPEDKQKLLKIASEQGLSTTKLGETIKYLIDNYQEHQKSKKNQKTPRTIEQYNSSEQQEIERAISNSGLSIEAITKEGTLQRARYLNSIAESQAKLDSMSESELKELTFKGVSRHRIAQAVETIKEHNDKQTEKKNKICLTRGIVFKITGSNRANINKFFAEYEVMISDHNHKHELTDADNRKGKGFDFKQLLGI